VQTAQQMFDAVLPQAPHTRCSSPPPRWPTGARPACPNTRSRRPAARSRPTFELTENPDILAAVAQLPERPYCVGFAAESDDLPSTPTRKLHARTCR
jgi:phosphopantothenoylcysteine decarboxylase/phosphopantothenate--cysteine ligase